MTGFSLEQLKLSQYEFEAKTDNYLLLSDDRNIKYRKKKLHYKPLVEQKQGAMIYGQKHKYHLIKQQRDVFCLLDVQNAPEMQNNEAMTDWLKAHFNICMINKESLTLKLPMDDLSIELSRLLIGSSVFYSLVVESLVLSTVNKSVAALGISPPPQDYVSFLKGLR